MALVGGQFGHLRTMTALLCEKKLQETVKRGWVGARASLDGCGEVKHLLILLRIEPQIVHFIA
jgi:hypothetical protein